MRRATWLREYSVASARLTEAIQEQAEAREMGDWSTVRQLQHEIFELYSYLEECSEHTDENARG